MSNQQTDWIEVAQILNEQVKQYHAEILIYKDENRKLFQEVVELREKIRKIEDKIK